MSFFPGEELLKSGSITLRPAILLDKRKIYSWLAHSNLTNEMLGLPNFPDVPVPTWDEFCADYHNYFFDGSQPMKGRCFIIFHDEKEIGQINYNEINSTTRSAEIDIWLADREFTGKGFGTESIKILCNYLNKSFECKTIYIAPSNRNVNAIKSYKKAGFIESDIFPENFIADYSDCILLVKFQ